MKKKIFYISFIFLFAIIFYSVGVKADDTKCFTMDFDNGGFPVASITVNGEAWHSESDTFNTNNGNYEIVILAGKNGDSFPDISTPGGLGTKVAIPNPGSTGTNDKYKLTLTIDNYENGACTFLGGISLIPGPEPTNSVSGNLAVRISGNDLEWHEQSDEASHFTFAINDSEMIFLKGDNLSFTKENGKIVRGETINPEVLPYSVAGDTVTLHMHTNPSEYIESMTINGVSYNAPKTKEELANAFYRDMLCISFDIDNIPKADTYNIVINAAHLAGDNQLTGGFGWKYSAEGNIDDATDRIPHGKIEFVKAIYNGVQYDTVSEFKNANRLFEWVDATKKDHYEIGDRSQFGYTFFPTGASVTIRIIPDAGYQLVGLRDNGDEFVRENEPGVYTFNVPGGSRALQANFVEINNEVQATSNKIKGGTIDTQEKVSNGTLKLEVTDPNVSSEVKTAFENKAQEEGYEVNNIVDISLYNSIYKGGSKDANGNYLSWDKEVNNLSNKATITLELNEDMSGKDIALVHEKHDGDKVTGYELVDVNYNSSTNTIEFEESSFSNFAIVVKENDVNNPDIKEKVKVDFDTRNGSSMAPIEIEKGSKLKKPTDPEKEGELFVGWFIDDECREEFDFDKPVEKDIILYAKWTDKVQRYTVNDGKGNTISFNEIKDREYELTMVDVIPMTDVELKALGATREQYNEVKKLLVEATSEYGTLLSFYQIEIKDKDDGTVITDGPFDIKIKITNEMKKYNEFKLIYVNDEFKAEEVIDLTIENGYLIGKLPHLSSYTLVGNYNSNLPDIPKTSDNIYLWIIVFIVSVISILASTKYIHSASKVRIK